MVELPLASQRYWEHVPGSEVVLETELSPGQCLYLPRGFIHSATTGTEPSLHISVILPALTVTAALDAQINAAGKQIKALRTALPPGYALPDRPTDPHGTDLINRLTFNADAVIDSAIERFWTTRTTPAPGRLTDLLTSHSLTLHTPLRRRPGTVARTQTAGEHLYLRIDDREIAMPATAQPLIHRLLTGPPTSLANLTHTHHTPHPLTLATRLLAEGLLTTT